MKRFLCVLLFLIICLDSGNVIAATKGEENALATAKDYLDFMNFSYKGIIEQLEYDGYSSTECRYAADNCGADWYDQAAGTARDYMSFMAFSKKGLVEQLEYDGYTREEAEYGAAVAYDENPSKPVKDDVDDSSILDDSIISDGNQDAEYHAKTTNTNEIERINSVFDLSGLTFEELCDLQRQVNLAIWASDKWQEVTISVGVYKVGEEIPAGKWTIKRSTNKYTYFRVGQKFENGKVKSYAFTSDLETKANLILEEGTYIEVSDYPVIFTPYVNSFSFK